MCGVCKGQFDEKNITLICSECREIRSIPLLPNLTFLMCSGCPGLTSIPLFSKLEYLDCDNCPFLYIPYKLRGLTKTKSNTLGLKLLTIVRRVRRKCLFKRLVGHLLPELSLLTLEYL